MPDSERFKRLFRRPGRAGVDEELREEIQFYLEERARELAEEGLTPEAAAGAARRAFGDVEAIHRRARLEARRADWDGKRRWMMGLFREDLRFTLRSFARRPGFTFVAVLTLAVGIGATSAIFSVTNAAMFRALPFDDADRLVFLNGTALVDGVQQVRGNSYPEFRSWRESANTIGQMAAYDGISLNLTGDGEPERVTAELVSAGYFELLGVQPLVGRTFRADEDRVPDQNPVAVLGWGMWQQRFGGDRDVVGRTVHLNERPYQVVGVAPRGFGGVNLDASIWIPTMMASASRSAAILEDRGSRWMGVVGRLAPEATLDEARSELAAIALGLQETYPDDHRDRSVQVQPLRAGYMGTTANLLTVLLAAGGVLLLVACANVTNLLLVRAVARKREIAMRRALGAERGRVVRQLLVESFVLAGLGGLAGAGVAWAGLTLMVPLIPAGVLPGYVNVGLDARVLAFSVGVLGLAGLLAGLAPAIASGRGSLSGALKAGAEPGRGERKLGVQDYFVVGQVALALALLVGAGLMIRTFQAQSSVEPGFQAENLYAFRMELPTERYEIDQVVSFARDLTGALEALPMVQSAAVGSDLPLRGLESAGLLKVEGDSEDRLHRFYRHRVGPGYLSTLGVPVLQGREINEEDAAGSPLVAVVSRAFVQRVYGGGDPVGRSLLFGRNSDVAARIVGVADDARFRSLTEDLLSDSDSPDVYLAYAQTPLRRIEVAVRSSADLGALMPRVRETVRTLDPQLPIYQIADMATGLRLQTAQARFGSSLLALFSVLALILASVGIYGVLAFRVGRRAREIAVRMALGATPEAVRGAVIRRGVLLVLLGVAVGSVAAAISGRALSTFLFGVRVADPLTFGAVIGVSLAAAVLAAWIPATRATRANPQVVLKAE